MEKEYLCSDCETGRIDYELDRHSPFCSYIGCYGNGECSKYISMMCLDQIQTEQRTELD